MYLSLPRSVRQRRVGAVLVVDLAAGDRRVEGAGAQDVLRRPDDVAVMGACLILVEQDLHKYRSWKSDQGKLE